MGEDHRTRLVDAVRLGRRTESTRPRRDHALNPAVLCPAGMVTLPRRDSGLGPDVADVDRLSRRHAAPLRWGADLRVDRQSAHRQHRSRRRDPGAASADRRGRPALRHDGAHLRALRSGIEGWQRSHGQDRQGGSDAHRSEPAAGLRLVRRPRNRLRPVLRHRQRPAASGKRPHPRRGGGRGTCPSAHPADQPAHPGTGHHPQRRHRPDDPVRVGALFDPARPGRRRSLGAGRRHRVGHRRRPRCPAPDPGLGPEQERIE